MLRLLIVAVATVCLFSKGTNGRNETIHACELVIKCFQDADIELMRCQSILSADPLPNNAVEGLESNDTTVAPTTLAPAPSDDCMAPVKQKMQQKRALVEQRAQAFALCLDERMDRGPEDVDPRKFRYCNTVISRYNARTTISTPPEFTQVTTPVSAESAPTGQQRLSTSTVAITTSKKSTQSTGTAGITNGRSSLVNSARTRSSIPLSQPIRPRRQASGANVQADSNSSVIRPPAAPPPSKRPEANITTITVTAKSTTTDPFDLPSTTATIQSQETPPQQLLPDSESGRVGSVARFSNGQSATANKDSESGPADKSQASKNNSASAQLSGPIPFDAGSQKPAISSKAAINQSEAAVPVSSQQEQKTSSESLTTSSAHNSSSSVSPSTTRSSELGQNGSQSTTTSFQSSTAAVPDHSVANSAPLKPLRNNTLGASPVLIQPQEQQEPSVIKATPLEQRIVDVQALSAPSGPSPPGTAHLPSTVSTSTTTATVGVPAAAGAAAPNAGAAGTADEKERIRVGTLRESRRRVSEFKACMARARIKREECKPLVNCCPDSVKCHLRYELSELHDQIHRLELDVSEGRQACLQKKKLDDMAVDALDQIDEEDLISDESIVSQQVF